MHRISNEIQSGKPSPEHQASMLWTRSHVLAHLRHANATFSWFWLLALHQIYRLLEQLRGEILPRQRLCLAGSTEANLDWLQELGPADKVVLVAC